MIKRTIIGIIIFIVVFIITIIILDKNDASMRLDKYSLSSDESIIKEFSYDNNNYAITTFNTNDSYSSHNFLYVKNNKYYKLDTIEKCDMSDYIKGNEIYIHCYGKKGDIIKYSINKQILDEEIIEFDYSNTPNISQIHMTIENIDNDYIYLSSLVKKNDSIKEGEHVKCSFKTKVCSYY